MRDLIRARTAATPGLPVAPRLFTGRKIWSPAHRRWLAGLSFAHPSKQIVLQEQMDAIAEADQRRDRLDEQIREAVRSWSMAPVSAAAVVAGSQSGLERMVPVWGQGKFGNGFRELRPSGTVDGRLRFTAWEILIGARPWPRRI
jgi:transposase